MLLSLIQIQSHKIWMRLFYYYSLSFALCVLLLLLLLAFFFCRSSRFTRILFNTTSKLSRTFLDTWAIRSYIECTPSDWHPVEKNNTKSISRRVETNCVRYAFLLEKKKKPKKRNSCFPSRVYYFFASSFTLSLIFSLFFYLSSIAAAAKRTKKLKFFFIVGKQKKKIIKNSMIELVSMTALIMRVYKAIRSRWRSNKD